MSRREPEPTVLSALLERLTADRVFVLVGGPAHRLSVEGAALLDIGARHVVIVGDGIGMDAPTAREHLSCEVLDVTGRTYSEARSRAGAKLGALPSTVLATLDAIDPERRAWVVNANNVYTGATVAGRRVLGRSHPSWTALEDKTTCHEVWQAAGVQQAPFEIVRARPDDLIDAARRLDRGTGTVWAGDIRDLVHGGAELTRWVRTSDDGRAVTKLLVRHCDRVRVMPFLEGIPCSIHGILTADGIATLRPCEMIVARDRTPGHLRMVGMGTAWDPLPGDRAEMKDVARRVGEMLRDRYGFQGTFTVDGVMTAEGFRPTELNPRVGAALAMMSASDPRMVLLMHTQFLAHGIDTGLRVDDVERLVLGAVDANRGLWASDFLTLDVAPVERSIVLDDAVPRLAVADEQRDGVVRVVPVRSYLPSAAVVAIDPGHLPVGPSSAPLVTAALDLAKVAAGLAPEHLEAALSTR